MAIAATTAGFFDCMKGTKRIIPFIC